jgi:tetratricopeptide (TPR) repeat protein
MLIPSLTFALALSLSTQQPATPPDPAALLQSGHADEARAAYESILRSDPANAAALEGEVAASEKLALDARAAGKLDDALTLLLHAREFAPQSPRLLLDLGILEDQMQLYHDADETLAQLDQLTPNQPTALYAIARVKLDLGQLALAEQMMQRYLALKPDDASAHYGLGRIYRQGLDFDKARTEFQRSIELQPQQSEAYYELGDAELQQGDYSSAIANFDKTLARNPAHGGALVGKGIAFFKQKQYGQAQVILEKATATDPDYQPGHYYLGLTLARLGRKDESERELAIATQLADRDNRAASNRLRLNGQQPQN